MGEERGRIGEPSVKPLDCATVEALVGEPLEKKGREPTRALVQSALRRAALLPILPRGPLCIGRGRSAVRMRRMALRMLVLAALVLLSGFMLRLERFA